MLKTSRTQANRWTRREDLPEPIARLRAMPVWRALGYNFVAAEVLEVVGAKPSGSKRSS
jgi:hypothetical protein